MRRVLAGLQHWTAAQEKRFTVSCRRAQVEAGVAQSCVFKSRQQALEDNPNTTTLNSADWRGQCTNQKVARLVMPQEQSGC